MLLFDTRKFDIQTYVLDSSDEAPCKIACNHFFKGDLMDFETVYNFGKKVDVLTFEIELVNLEALEKLEAEGLPVYPSPKTLRLIQNKGVQKDFYTQPLPILDLIRRLIYKKPLQTTKYKSLLCGNVLNLGMMEMA